MYGPRLGTFLFCSSFSIIHILFCLISPKYRILTILYCGQIWPMTRGKVINLIIRFDSVLHQWTSIKMVDKKTGQRMANPNLGCLPSKSSLVVQYSTFLLLMFQNSKKNDLSCNCSRNHSLEKRFWFTYHSQRFVDFHLNHHHNHCYHYKP